jgi:uncharacterized repeat protein (TIGR01451 family)
LTCTWTCAGAGGGICNASGSGNISEAVNLPAGSSVTFTVPCTVSPAATGTISNTATVNMMLGGPTDTNPGNNSATDSDTVGAQADLAITKTLGNPGPVQAGQNAAFTITITNAGPSDAVNVVLSDPFPAGTTYGGSATPATWSCSTAANVFTCSIASFPVGATAVFQLAAAVNASVPAGTVLTNTATVTAATTDPAPGNNSATATATVTSGALVSGTKTVGAGTHTPGSALTYTVVLTNSGTGAQGDNPGNEFIDVLPAGLTLVGASATSGTATTDVGTRTVTWNGSIPAGGSVTITINATIDANVAPGTTLTNQGTFAYDADGNGTNEASGMTDDPAPAGTADPTSFQVAPGVAPPPVPTLDGIGLMVLALLLALGGAWTVRRRPREE